MRQIAQRDLHDVGGDRGRRLESGSSVRLGCWPAAIATTIVSPTAREMPSTKAAATPEIAAGSTTLIAVSNLVAPSASEPSRRPLGTARKASSLSEAI